MSRARFSFPIFVPFLLAGCGGAAMPTDPRGNLLLSDANNYNTHADLNKIPTVATAAATDIDICWSSIVDDLQCHAVSATADLDNVALLRISHLTKQQVQI